MDLEPLRYPIGRFQWKGESTQSDREQWIRIIAGTPDDLRKAVSGLSDSQLNTPYRPGGWTARQVVHHYADGHMNSYVRFKLALTEESPTIKSYLEAVWAEVPDARCGAVEPSLNLLTALHVRWVEAWQALNEPDWQRTFFHPGRKEVSLEQLACLCAWHGQNGW